MAVRLRVGIGRLNADISAALHRCRLHGRLRHTLRCPHALAADALADDALVVGAAGVELPEVDACEREGAEAGVDGVRHVVAVDPAVALVGHVHHVAVGPDAARAVVAGPAQLRELLVAAHAFELEVLGRGVLLRVEPGEAVGEEALGDVIGDPDADAVGPDAVRVAVCGVERVLREQFAACEVVGEEGVVAAIEHPDRRAGRPDAAWVVVVGVQCEVGVGEALAAREGVCEELVLAAVGDPDGAAIRPEATRREVGVVELELKLLDALAGGEVVGVDGVVGAVAVLGEPERRAIGPGAGG